MGGLEIRELECFLVLAEELHFGRTGERLYVSQSRVSQLLRALEGRVGGRLVDRTSRRVALTPLGEHFLSGLRPAYDALRASVEDARSAARANWGVLRVGFQGVVDERVLTAIGTFEAENPGCAVEITELPLSDPFGAVHRGEIDTAVALLPVAEPDLVAGLRFAEQAQTVAVSLRHPFADRPSVTAEDLADHPLIAPGGPAPGYWRRAQAPVVTPKGRPIPRGPEVSTLQEGLALAAADRGVFLVCRPTAGYSARRDVAFVPVTGLPGSVLGLVRRRASDDVRLRALYDAVAV